MRAMDRNRASACVQKRLWYLSDCAKVSEGSTSHSQDRIENRIEGKVVEKMKSMGCG